MHTCVLFSPSERRCSAQAAQGAASGHAAGRGLRARRLLLRGVRPRLRFPPQASGGSWRVAGLSSRHRLWGAGLFAVKLAPSLAVSERRWLTGRAPRRPSGSQTAPSSALSSSRTCSLRRGRVEHCVRPSSWTCSSSDVLPQTRPREHAWGCDRGTHSVTAWASGLMGGKLAPRVRRGSRRVTGEPRAALLVAMLIPAAARTPARSELGPAPALSSCSGTGLSGRGSGEWGIRSSSKTPKSLK